MNERIRIIDYLHLFPGEFRREQQWTLEELGGMQEMLKALAEEFDLKIVCPACAPLPQKNRPCPGGDLRALIERLETKD